MLPLNTIGPQGATRLGPAHLGHTEHTAGATPAPGMQHCPAQDRLGHHATRFRRPDLAAHANRFAARHGTGRAALQELLNGLMEDNRLLMKRLQGQDHAKGPHEADGETDPVLKARQESLRQTEEVARLTKMMQEARVVAKIKKDTLDWIMQNLL